jgi:hypothetical protein
VDVDVDVDEGIPTLAEVYSEHDAAASKTNKEFERMERQLQRAHKKSRLQHLAQPKHKHAPPSALPKVTLGGKRQANRKIRRNYGL